MIKKIIISIFVLIAICVAAILIIAPAKVDQSKNQITPHKPYVISKQAQQLHDSLIVGDWHADSLLWNRDLSKHNDYGLSLIHI